MTLKLAVRRKGSSNSGWYMPPRGTHTGEKHRAVSSGKAGGWKGKPSLKPERARPGSGKPAKWVTAPEWAATDNSEASMMIRAGRADTTVPGADINLGVADLSDHNVRGRIKDAVVSDLSQRTDIPYSDVNTFVKQWSWTSNDDDYRSLSIQEAAAKEFDTPLSLWQEGKVFDAKAGKHGFMAKRHVFEGRKSPGADARKVLRSMYDATQARFKEQGIETVTLYRGASIKGAVPTVPKLGSQVKLNENAISSWSSSMLIANRFSTATVGMEVPVSRIMATATTGFGCLNEMEFIVIGSNLDVATVERGGY